MTYTVEVRSNQTDVSFTERTRKDAQKSAREACKEYGKEYRVFISGFRRQDGQIMYLNRARWECVGENWNQ